MRSPITRRLAQLGAVALTSIACLPAAAQSIRAPTNEAILATLNRLSIELPPLLFNNEPIKTPLEALAREPCDQKAIQDLGDALEKMSRRREAATAHISFSATCPGHYAPSLRSAVNILLTLSDYKQAEAVASNLIALEPFNDNGNYLRALARDRAGALKPAIDDYVTALELFGNKERISSVAYLAMARAYEKLGQFCDAVLPIESWVAINPARNDTSQTRAIIADYTARGHCQAPAGGQEVFRITRPHNTVKLPVSVRIRHDGARYRRHPGVADRLVCAKGQGADRSGERTAHSHRQRHVGRQAGPRGDHSAALAVRQGRADRGADRRQGHLWGRRRRAARHELPVAFQSFDRYSGDPYFQPEDEIDFAARHDLDPRRLWQCPGSDQSESAALRSWPLRA